MLWAAGAVAAHSRPSRAPFPRATGLRLRVAANFGVAVRTPARQPTAPATGSLQRPVRPPALNCDRLSATPSLEMAAAADADASTVSVRFVSRLPEPVDIPDSAFAVPEGLTRKGLAEVINGLLQLDPPQPWMIVPLSMAVDVAGAPLLQRFRGQGKKMLKALLQQCDRVRGTCEVFKHPTDAIRKAYEAHNDALFCLKRRVELRQKGWERAMAVPKAHLSLAPNAA